MLVDDHPGEDGVRIPSASRARYDTRYGFRVQFKRVSVAENVMRLHSLKNGDSTELCAITQDETR